MKQFLNDVFVVPWQTLTALSQLAFAALLLVLVALFVAHYVSRIRRLTRPPRTPEYDRACEICHFIGGPLDGRYMAAPCTASDYWAYKPTGPMLGVWKANELGITRTKVRYTRTGPKEFTVDCDDAGGHEWKFRDDSFDHAFGTERIHYFECERCGTHKRAESQDFAHDDDVA